MKVTVIVETKSFCSKKTQTAKVELSDCEEYGFRDPQIAEEEKQERLRNTLSTILKELNSK
jgi:hypothetical protein